jgi:hypothetical protein
MQLSYNKSNKEKNAKLYQELKVLVSKYGLDKISICSLFQKQGFPSRQYTNGGCVKMAKIIDEIEYLTVK